VDSCHLPLRKKGGSYYKAKSIRYSLEHSGQQETVPESSTLSLPETGPSTKVTTERIQLDHSPNLKRVIDGKLEITSATIAAPDILTPGTSGITPFPLPPITVLNNIMSLEGKD